MGTLTIPNVLGQADLFDSSKLNNNFSTIATVVNGNLDATNISIKNHFIVISKFWTGNLTAGNNPDLFKFKNISGTSITFVGLSVRCRAIGAAQTLTILPQKSSTSGVSWTDLFVAGQVLQSADQNNCVSYTGATLQNTNIASNDWLRLNLTVSGGVHTDFDCEFWFKAQHQT